MPNPLNYEAEVPINIKAPFSVNADPNKPPGDRFVDYKPSAKSVAQVKQDERVKRGNYARAPVSRYEQDYISPEDAVAKRKSEKHEIMLLAKQIYEDDKSRRVTWKAAEELVEKGLPEDDPAFVRAKKVLQKGRPLTKEEAIEKAAKQFYGLRA